MKTENYGEIVDAGMDWLTLTSTTGPATEQLTREWARLMDEQKAMGGVVKKWGMQGYKGLKCGAVRGGARGIDEAILILSGDLANLRGWSFPIPPSQARRVDLQVTVRFDRPDPEMAYKLYSDLSYAQVGKDRKRKLKFMSSAEGETLYVGRRGQGVLLRFYDKSVAYGELSLGRVWRYEVEFGRRAAPVVYEKMVNYSSPYIDTAGQVFAEFKKRGVLPRFEIDKSITAIEVGRRITDAQSQINWLAKCVAPVFVQLSLAGYERQAIEALGIAGIVRKAGE